MSLRANIRKYEYYHSPSFLKGKLKTVETAGVGVKAAFGNSPRGRRRRRRKRKVINGGT